MVKVQSLDYLRPLKVRSDLISVEILEVQVDYPTETFGWFTEKSQLDLLRPTSRLHIFAAKSWFLIMVTLLISQGKKHRGSCGAALVRTSNSRWAARSSTMRRWRISKLVSRRMLRLSLDVSTKYGSHQHA